MSLFASLNLARLALGAHQTAIQTVGQNIANANTEGYARQRVQMSPTPSDDMVFARVGTGVQIERIERIVDEHLEGNLRDARSGLGDLAERLRTFNLAEAVFNDLGGGGLSESLSQFFEALEDLSNNPEDPTARSELVVQSGTLVETLHFMDSGVRSLRSNVDDDIVSVVQNINRLTTEIAELNAKIVEAEDGGLNLGIANNLRSQRDAALGELSDHLEIKVIENSRGAVQVLSGNDALVVNSRQTELLLDPRSDGDISYHDVRLADNGQKLKPKGGRLAALLDGRDSVAVTLRTALDEIASGLLTEFNAIHVQGEGSKRYSEVQSLNAVTSPNVVLAEAGLPFAVENGRFDFQLVNEGDGTRETYTIAVDPQTMTLSDVAAAINAQVGSDHPEIVAGVTVDGLLEIESTSTSLTFTFREDDSNFLVAAGVGTFFSGTNARNIDLSQLVVDDPSLFASGAGGGIGDNTRVLEMLALRDAPVMGKSSMTFEEFYQATIGELGVQGAEARELHSNQEAIFLSVKNQREALSGVNVDEEAISLIQFQRAYQGAARFLNVVDGLLETLINSV